MRWCCERRIAAAIAANLFLILLTGSLLRTHKQQDEHLPAVGGLARVYATHGVLRDAAAIAASLFLIVLASILLGTALPFALSRLGVDPAHAGSSIQVEFHFHHLYACGIKCKERHHERCRAPARTPPTPAAAYVQVRWLCQGLLASEMLQQDRRSVSTSSLQVCNSAGFRVWILGFRVFRVLHMNLTWAQLPQHATAAIASDGCVAALQVVMDVLGVGITCVVCNLILDPGIHPALRHPAAAADPLGKRLAAANLT